MELLFPYPKMGDSWLDILEDPLTRKVLGHDAVMAEETPFISGVTSRLKFLLADPLKHLSFAKVGYSALEAFLQANCTGPPLDFDSVPIVIPRQHMSNINTIKREIFDALSVDGIDIHSLTPHLELFWLAKTILSNSVLAEEGFNGRRARLRVTFWHQKLLTEPSDTLKDLLYKDATILGTQMESRLSYGATAAQEHMVEFLLERANIRIYHGDADSARTDLLRAAQLRDFDFALTGALGKKTKYQGKDVSQLVVLAKSRDHEPEPYSSRKSSRVDGYPASRKGSVHGRRISSLRPQTPLSPSNSIGENPFDRSGSEPSLSGLPPTVTKSMQPKNIALDDDTLLEYTAFTTDEESQPKDKVSTIVSDASHLPGSLIFLDPADQPRLFPVDSLILLSIASSITNTAPGSGLTREETLPYATRVLQGGSSNWSVYTQALLVRSRIEGYKSRTAERGLLQLQALVDQVIAETSGTSPKLRNDDSLEKLTGDTIESPSAPAVFLPAPTMEESASVAERLQYIHQISPPYIWSLESELAARWTQMGGLRSALDIYRRLQMNAEVALCLAATDEEAKASALLRELLLADPDQQAEAGPEIMLREPKPADAPRLLCILGDIEQNPKWYDRAWQSSGNHYARAQRSLGTFYLKKKELVKAAEAYTLALGIARLDEPTWFSLGCVQLELEDYQGAAESFTRVVQLEEREAQGWSNLAVALLRLPPPLQKSHGDEDSKTINPQRQNEKIESLLDIESSDTIQEEKTSTSETAEDDIPARGQEQNEEHKHEIDPFQHTREALRALQRAAVLKRDDARIWDNLLTVAASIPPNADNPTEGTPWSQVIAAMSRVISLRSQKEGEGCVDLKIVSALVDWITNVYDYPSENDEFDEMEEAISTVKTVESQSTNGTKETASPDDITTERPRKYSVEAAPDDISTATNPSANQLESAYTKPVLPFLLRSFLRLMAQIAPLASSHELFLLLSRVALWRHRPAESLASIEKSWRATSNQVGVRPNQIVEATNILVEGYKMLGPMERERTGGMVEKGWRTKARMAVKSSLGKVRGIDAGIESETAKSELEKSLDGLKAANSAGE